MELPFTEVVEVVARVIEAVAVTVLVVSGLAAGARAVSDALRRRDWYTRLRRNLGRGLLLGLEILVAADIVETVAVALTLENVLTLGALVLVRTILSFSIAAEVEGVVPWRRAAMQREEGRQPAVSPPTGGRLAVETPSGGDGSTR